MVPYIGVFDNLSYKVDHGMVTLLGQVTQPVRKTDVERAVKRIPGVHRRQRYQIEVLPLSRFDDQIRVRTLRTMLRSSSSGQNISRACSRASASSCGMAM